MAAMIQLREIAKSFPMRGEPVHALQGVDLDVGTAEFVAITGASGSGKSTLLHIVGTLERPSAGTYRFAERDMGRLDDDARAHFRSRHVGFIFQAFHLIPQLDLVQNVALPFLYGSDFAGSDRDRALEALDSVGLAHRARHRPSELSGGEMQRAAIARAIVSGPRVVLADEPTGNLDPGTGEEILRLLEGLVERGTTVIMATHDERIAARAPAHVRMKVGRLE